MANPVLARGFQPVPVPVQSYPQQGYPPQGYPQQGYDPRTYAAPMAEAPKLMTFDDVVTKSGITLVSMMLVAALAFVLLPDPTSAYLVSAGAGLVGFVVAMVVSLRRTVTPVGAILYSVIEGLFVGGVTKSFESMYPGIAGQAVLGTFAAAAVTLLAVRAFKIRVGSRFRRVVMIGTMAFALAMLANFLLQFAGVNLGLVDAFGSVSGLAVGMTALGTVLAVLNLVTDFDYIQRGIASGAPASESWRAAFGLTVTMVWLYINILRILSYLRN